MKNCVPYHITTDKDILKFITKRDGDLNKGDFGRALIVCGSYGMTGAAVLATKAALRCGVGLCELFVPASIYSICAVQLPEAVFTTYSDDACTDDILKLLHQRLTVASSCLVGCGLSVSNTAREITNFIIQNSKCPVIIDADGINNICEHIDILKTSKAQIMLTPHPGEMSRLTNHSVKYINSNRIDVAKTFSEKYNVNLLLKGANTVIVTKRGHVYINNTGNAGMAKGGSGDVLSGIAVSLAAQNVSPEDILYISAYIHGKAGDIAAENMSRRSMLATDIIDALHTLFLEYEKD